MRLLRTPTTQQLLTEIKRLRAETRAAHKRLVRAASPQPQATAGQGNLFGMPTKDFWDLVIKAIGLIALLFTAIQLLLQYRDLTDKRLQFERQIALDQKKYYQDLRVDDEKKTEADRDFRLHESQFLTEKLNGDRSYAQQQKEFGEQLNHSFVLLEKNNELTIRNKRSEIQKDIFLELSRCLAILTNEPVGSEKYVRSLNTFNELKDGQIILLGDKKLSSAVNAFSCYLDRYDWLGRAVSLSNGIYKDLQALKASRPWEIFSLHMDYYPDNRDALTIAREKRYRDYFETAGQKLQDMKDIYQKIPGLINPSPCVFNYDTTVYRSLEQPFANYIIAYVVVFGGSIDSVKKYTMEFEDVLKAGPRGKVDSSMNFSMRSFAGTVDSLITQMGKISRGGDSVLRDMRKIIVQQRDSVMTYLVRSSEILDNGKRERPVQ